MNSKTICLIGPTGSGKTSVAFDLARSIGGEVVNLDKIYIYKQFQTGTGLSDSLKESGIKKHLYCLIEPNEEIISPEIYAKMIRATCLDISKRGNTAIIEGGSTTYFPALYIENERDPFIDQIYGIYFPKNFDIAKKIEERITSVLDEGLLEEVRMGMEKYPESLIMKDCHFVVPMVRYLNSEIDLNGAKREVVQRCLLYIKHQMECFRSFPNIKWVEYGKFSLS